MDLLVPLSFIPRLYSLNSLSQVLFVRQLTTSRCRSLDYVTRLFFPYLSLSLSSCLFRQLSSVSFSFNDLLHQTAVYSKIRSILCLYLSLSLFRVVDQDHFVKQIFVAIIAITKVFKVLKSGRGVGGKRAMNAKCNGGEAGAELFSLVTGTSIIRDRQE